jgi:predicted TIM-barrel fold metal-dependent hydrolase
VIIDVHVHLYPAAANLAPARWARARREAHWEALATRVRKKSGAVQRFPSVDELVRDMDAGGVQRAVLLGWYWEHPETCLEQNEFYAECIRTHPDRLRACATLHPAAGVAETRRRMESARESGFKGLGELSPHSQHHAIDDPGFEAALALAGEWRWPVFLHVTDPAGKAYPGRVETPLADFTTLAERFPGTDFVLAHWGGLLALQPEAAGHRNLYYDTAASPLLYDAGVWRRLVDSAGADRILFGSDYPLNLYPGAESEPGWGRFLSEVREAGLTAAELEQVLSRNAQRLFN